MAKINESIETIPAHWVYFLTYGEDDTMTEKEQNFIQSFMDSKFYNFFSINVIGEKFFTNNFNIFDGGFSKCHGGDVVEIKIFYYEKET